MALEVTEKQIDKELDFVQNKLCDVCPSCKKGLPNHHHKCVRNHEIRLCAYYIGRTFKVYYLPARRMVKLQTRYPGHPTKTSKLKCCDDDFVLLKNLILMCRARHWSYDAVSEMKASITAEWFPND